MVEEVADDRRRADRGRGRRALAHAVSDAVGVLRRVADHSRAYRQALAHAGGVAPLVRLVAQGGSTAQAVKARQEASVALEEVPRRLVGRPDAQPIVATNVFVRAAGGAWKVSMHHASVIMR